MALRNRRIAERTFVWAADDGRSIREIESLLAPGNARLSASHTEAAYEGCADDRYNQRPNINVSIFRRVVLR